MNIKDSTTYQKENHELQNGPTINITLVRDTNLVK
jgi:hypothetical protein